ncbi:hypothetical protein P3T76_009533 [Phytophthora citrophthora]|nr:hypothetical protein P3T76_009533 [Phytophthora citrophthora]
MDGGGFRSTSMKDCLRTVESWKTLNVGKACSGLNLETMANGEPKDSEPKDDEKNVSAVERVVEGRYQHSADVEVQRDQERRMSGERSTLPSC